MNCFRCLKMCNKKGIAGKREIEILVLGLKSSGKTELCYSLCDLKRNENSSTVGVSVYNIDQPTFNIKLTEIGGSEPLIDIWKYYYADCMGIIYVIDSQRSKDNFEKNRDTLKTLLSKDFLNGKPFLIIGTFQDKDNVYNLIEFCYIYDFENYASLVKTPFYVDVCDINTYKIMKRGLNWMINLIEKNFHSIENRVKFDKKLQEVTLKIEENYNKTLQQENSMPKIFRPATAPPSFIKKKKIERKNSEVGSDKN